MSLKFLLNSTISDFMGLNRKSGTTNYLCRSIIFMDQPVFVIVVDMKNANYILDNIYTMLYDITTQECSWFMKLYYILIGKKLVKVINKKFDRVKKNIRFLSLHNFEAFDRSRGIKLPVLIDNYALIELTKVNTNY